jgi:L-aspartate oxidase
MNMQELQVDCVVVGGGAAGLSAALRAADLVNVALITKRGLSDSTTSEAQGGIAVSLGPDDDAALHAEDTLAAGAGLCEREAVEVLVKEGIDRVQDLLRVGAGFDRKGDELLFSQEAAHSRRRVVRARGDATGREVQRILAQEASRNGRIQMLEHTAAQGLLVEDGVCRGVIAVKLTSGEPVLLTASAVVLATGGAGQLYARTTNPEVATGDGIAIALQAGAELMDMEFVQFHPTVLLLPNAPPFLISEAVRGEGAILKNVRGESFMAKYHPDRELAPRDIVSRSIMAEMRATESDHVWLDLTEIEGVNLPERFPTIAENCLRLGVDITREPVPVAPAAHYLMGGIRTDSWGRTGLWGLLACGECACLGLHGANRLASNSILEGLVFGYRAGQAAGDMNETQPRRLTSPRLPMPSASPSGLGRGGLRPSQTPTDAEGGRIGALRRRLQTLMWDKVGLARCGESLEEAEEAFGEISSQAASLAGSWQGTEAANMATLAQVIVRCALLREESRGGHFRTDFPLQDDLKWAKHSLVRLDSQGSMGVSFLPVGEGVLHTAKMRAAPVASLGSKSLGSKSLGSKSPGSKTLDSETLDPKTFTGGSRG